METAKSFAERNWQIFTMWQGDMTSKRNRREHPTLKQIGKMFGIGPVRVRQIVSKQVAIYVAFAKRAKGWSTWTPEMQYNEFNDMRSEG